MQELPQALREIGRVTLTDAETARRQADIVAFLVGHGRFRRMEKALFLDKVVVDAVGLMR